jgi:SprT-like family protein
MDVFLMSTRDYNPFLKNSCKRDLDLQSVFTSFNKKYFRGKLPRYQVLVCSRSRNFSHMSAGYCSSEDRKIFLRSGISRNSSLQTLTHEMIHAKLWWLTRNVHGRAFVKELKRVRKLGAPLSSSELDLKAEGYFEQPKLARRNVEDSIRYALVLEGLQPRYIPKFLELEFHLPYSVIRGQVPDVEDIIDKMSLYRIVKDPPDSFRQFWDGCASLDGPDSIN